MKKYVFTLDLKNDQHLVDAYLTHHQSVWPEVINSIRHSQITKMEIYHVANRLMMIMETSDDFSFVTKAANDAADPKVQAWETLMDKYQEKLPFAKQGEKWVRMEQIFSLGDNSHLPY
jgi:L-rhamnose mutarotase